MRNDDRESIVRYLDGELDSRARADFEAALAADPALAGEVSGLRALDEALKASFADDRGGAWTVSAVPVRAAPQRYSRRPAMALAASVAVAVAAGAMGWLLRDAADPTGASDLVAWQLTLQQTLEDQPSHTLVSWPAGEEDPAGSIEVLRTYRAADGRYCREYRSVLEADIDVLAGIGIACRSPSGIWQTETLNLASID